MNEPRRDEQVPAVYPPYLTVPYQEDEIDLVDLWVKLRAYRRVFWFAFLALLILGLAYVFAFHRESYSLNTALQIGVIDNGKQVVKIDTPESLKGKLNSALIPVTTAEWLKRYPELDIFKTEVDTPKNSDVVIVKNKIFPEQKAIFSGYQQELMRRILEDHQKLVELYQADLRASLEDARAKLEELQDPRTLQTQLEKLQLQIQTAEQKLQHLKETQALIEKGGKEGVLRSMTDEQKQLLLDRNGQVDDRVLQARFEEILLNNKIQQDQQAQTIASLKLKIDEVKLDLERKIQNQQRKVQDIEFKLKSFNVSRVVSEPVLSVKPSGLSRKLMAVLVVFIAGILAFLAMLLMMFRDKVHQRLQEPTHS